jgi:hypothetical protein
MKIGINRRVVAAGAAALLVAVGGGGAIAATATGGPEEESRAVIDDAAERLGVESTALSAALKQALAARVDAAVADGRLTEARAAEIKERIAADDFPLVGMFGRPGHHGPGGGRFLDLGAAATYLGVTAEELRTSLRDGDTLAEVAGEEGKSVAGLIAALVEAAKARLAADVEAGRITDAQRDEKVAGLQARVTELVNRSHPRPPGRERPTM